MGIKTNGPLAGRLALENLTADTVLEDEDSGKVFLLDIVGEAITIPAAAPANRGVHYTFIMNAKCGTSDWTITSRGTNDIHLQISAGGATEADKVSAGTGKDKLTFVFTAADEGDHVRLFSTGTFWMALGSAHLTANITIA